MSARKLEKHVRREQISLATLKLAAAGGIGAVSMARIAADIGVVPSALYRHFKNKDEALDAAVELMIDKLIANTRLVCLGSIDPIKQLHALLRRHVGLIHQNQGVLQIIFSLDFYIAHPERRERIYGGLREYLAKVADMIRAGQRTGQINPALDATTAAVVFLGLVQPSAILWQMSDGQFNLRKQVKNAWPLYQRMLECGATLSLRNNSSLQQGARHDYKKHKSGRGA